MSRPTKCGQCGTFVAPQLSQCPQCDTSVKHPSAVDDKLAEREELRAQQERLDRDAKVLDSRKLRWVIPESAQENMRQRLKAHAKRPSMSKSLVKLIEHDAHATRAGCWSWEHGEHSMTVFISPKGNRYVRARSNERAHLVIVSTQDKHGKDYASPLRTRLRKYEQSNVAKTLAKTAKEQAQRQKAKADKRADKKKKSKLLKALKEHAIIGRMAEAAGKESVKRMKDKLGIKKGTKKVKRAK